VGLRVTSTREPGGTAVGEAIRRIFLFRTEINMPGETELFLVLAARAAFVRQVVRPALAPGEVVLADRFSLSTLAYQGYGRGLDLAEIRRLDALARGGLEPDLTLVLQLPPEEGVRRQQEAHKGRDRIERAGEEFHMRVARGYRELAGGGDPKVRAVDALGTPDAVHERVRDALREAFPGTFPPPQD
jgi:dTMP kinase